MQLFNKIATRLFRMFRPKPQGPRVMRVDSSLEDLTTPPMRVGIIGAGFIAGAMARTLNGMDSAEAYAIASRDVKKARKFAEDWNITKAYGSYEELVADPNVDLVYIATPNAFHYECTLMALNHDKPCLVEKPFALNAEQAQELFSLAESRQLFILEAVWTRFMPIFFTLRQRIQEGIIGKLQHIEVSVGWDMRKNPRILSKELGGGALYDVGVYGMNVVRMLTSADWQVTDLSFELDNNRNVDMEDSIRLSTTDGEVSATIIASANRFVQGAVVKGSKGTIEMDYAINPQQVRIYDLGHTLVESIDRPVQFSGYEYEVLACRRALCVHATECSEMPHSETLQVLRWMDGLRRRM